MQVQVQPGRDAGRALFSLQSTYKYAKGRAEANDIGGIVSNTEGFSKTCGCPFYLPLDNRSKGGNAEKGNIPSLSPGASRDLTTWPACLLPTLATFPASVETGWTHFPKWTSMGKKGTCLFWVGLPLPLQKGSHVEEFLWQIFRNTHLLGAPFNLLVRYAGNELCFPFRRPPGSFPHSLLSTSKGLVETGSLLMRQVVLWCRRPEPVSENPFRAP